MVTIDATAKNLVIKFVEYTYRMINEDLDVFFEDNMMEFDQDDEDITTGRGETLQQYEIYKKYLELAS